MKLSPLDWQSLEIAGQVTYALGNRIEARHLYIDALALFLVQNHGHVRDLVAAMRLRHHGALVGRLDGLEHFHGANPELREPVGLQADRHAGLCHPVLAAERPAGEHGADGQRRGYD